MGSIVFKQNDQTYAAILLSYTNTKNVVIGALKHVFGELSVKYVDFHVFMHKIQGY